MQNRLLFFLCCLCALASFSTPASAQQDYMDKLAERSCSCIKNSPDTLNEKQLKIRFGLCLMEQAMPFKKQLKKDLDIDMDNLGKDGERLGAAIGLKMAGVCPDMLLRLSSKFATDADEGEEGTFVGTVNRIEDNDMFVCFVLRDKTGRTAKLYWMDYVESKLDLMSNYKKYVGNTLRVTYKNKELFDPKVKDYRKFMVIQTVSAE